jgi:hypothetical protein
VQRNIYLCIYSVDINVIWEKFEDTKGNIKHLQSKIDKQCNSQGKWDKTNNVIAKGNGIKQTM